MKRFAAGGVMVARQVATMETGSGSRLSVRDNFRSLDTGGEICHLKIPAVNSEREGTILSVVSKIQRRIATHSSLDWWQIRLRRKRQSTIQHSGRGVTL